MEQVTGFFLTFFFGAAMGWLGTSIVLNRTSQATELQAQAQAQKFAGGFEILSRISPMCAGLLRDKADAKHEK